MTVTVFLNVKTINIFVDLHRLLVYYLPLDYNFIDVCLLVCLSVGRITLIQLHRFLQFWRTRGSREILVIVLCVSDLGKYMCSTERQFRFPNPAIHCTALLFIFRILFPFVRHITATICICNDLTVFRDRNSIRFTCLLKCITHTSIFWRQFTVILVRSMHSTQRLSSFPMLIYSSYCIISYCMLPCYNLHYDPLTCFFHPFDEEIVRPIVSLILNIVFVV